MTSPIGSPTAGNLLAVSTQSLEGSLAVRSNGEIKEIAWTKQAIHSELAPRKLEALLSDVGISVSQLTHIAVNIGPGSFTGIRVGVNLARTLAYALSLPIAPINALEVIAHRDLKLGERAVVALKAVQNYFYAGEYAKTDQGLVELRAPFSTAALPPTDVRAEGVTAGFRASTSARDLIESLTNARFLTWPAVGPLYVRGSEAEEKMRKGLLKPLN